ncbi:phage tail tube protein [Rhizobium sp. Nf11,1]|uniref:phage tail tube protein n=1 Tax=Rhizobium sp. Nf11,1 TaxID=3404923 RepID=UPI003D350CED
MGKDFGGRMLVRLSDGTTMSMRGTFSVNTAGQSNEAVTNQDGSSDRIGTPMPYRASATFRDDNADLGALMRSPRLNVTIFEEFSGVTHYFTNAFFTGDPESNRLNGELTNLTVNSEQYNRSTG